MPRLLAVTVDAGLLERLLELPPAWRIVTADSVEDAASRVGPEVSVALVDLGDPGVDDAARRRLTRWWPDVPCLTPTPGQRGAWLTSDLHEGLRALIDAEPDPEGEPDAEAPAEVAQLPTPGSGPEPARDADPEPEPEPGTHAGHPPAIPLTPWDDERPTGHGHRRQRPERPAAPAAGCALARRLQARLLGGLSSRQAEAEARDRPVPERIERSLPALADVAHLVADLPAVGTLEAVGSALVAEVVAHLDADTISVLVDGSDGRYEVLASHGLTPAERRLRVVPDHPVLADLTANVDAVLLAPLDEGRAFVGGLPGARGDGLIAASLDVDTGPVAFVTAARERPFTPKDLDRLRLIASEAAPAFGLALALRRLRLEPSVAAGR